MNPLLEKLHDIEGLDPISIWPLAIGWKILIGLGILILCYIIYRIVYMRTWKAHVLRELSALEKNLSNVETLIILSEYLRRIALKRYSRKECAGLSGESWLDWLSKNDPKKFDWKSHGQPLINAPYAPINYKISDKQVKDLILAVKGWVR